ncbi:MAG: hypothetical protein UY48_C0002G0018 [Candidatus Gottesmanbacteria bacterium GW2011_GWB1_49_7]|uniref:Uncharacterized protein n=1 Tax=Candidatus Gottesmanbacteria bacterium GW2011_GWB1_49_7 TaxID=1618448 RepID=A0A0G1YED8_9BACT|nr:MAG: hypothetical protein UY48_C0002G0018 [Candidatus Gottesmanbacteria bacterium GW2011_GWB1_49_7]
MKAHWKYLQYVLRHKWFVFLEACRLGIPWRGFWHDWSKFLPSEWFAYVEYFYTNRRQTEWFDLYSKYGAAELAPYGETVQDHFDLAWLFHQKRNPHHWQFWVLRKDDGNTRVLFMPGKYAREMVADWCGMGRAVGKPDTRTWYQENQGKILLHPLTRNQVERLLGLRPRRGFPYAPRADGTGEETP